jgi:hypothetical protein
MIMFKNHSCHWLQPMFDDEFFERRIHSPFKVGKNEPP